MTWQLPACRQPLCRPLEPSACHPFPNSNLNSNTNSSQPPDFVGRAGILSQLSPLLPESSSFFVRTLRNSFRRRSRRGSSDGNCTLQGQGQGQSQGHQNRDRVIALTGSAGIGKTHVARRFCAENFGRYHENVRWIRGETFKIFAHDLLQLAKHLNLCGDPVTKYQSEDRDVSTEEVAQICAEVYRHFDKLKREKEVDCLFIFDGVTFDISKFLPRSTVPALLITTRDGDKLEEKSVDSSSQPLKKVELTEFSTEETIAYFQQNFNLDPKKVAEKGSKVTRKILKLHKIFQGYPPAIRMAAGYIRQLGETDLDTGHIDFRPGISAFLQFFKNHRENETKSGGLKNFFTSKPDSDSDSNPGALEHLWNFIVKTIESRGTVGEIALEILSKVTYLPRYCVEVGHCREMGLHLLSSAHYFDRVQQALEMLQNYALVTIEGQTQGQSSNRIVMDTEIAVLARKRAELLEHGNFEPLRHLVDFLEPYLALHPNYWKWSHFYPAVYQAAKDILWENGISSIPFSTSISTFDKATVRQILVFGIQHGDVNLCIGLHDALQEWSKNAESKFSLNSTSNSILTFFDELTASKLALAFLQIKDVWVFSLSFVFDFFSQLFVDVEHPLHRPTVRQLMEWIFQELSTQNSLDNPNLDIPNGCPTSSLEFVQVKILQFLLHRKSILQEIGEPAKFPKLFKFALNFEGFACNEIIFSLFSNENKVFPPSFYMEGVSHYCRNLENHLQLQNFPRLEWEWDRLNYLVMNLPSDLESEFFEQVSTVRLIWTGFLRHLQENDPFFDSHIRSITLLLYNLWHANSRPLYKQLFDQDLWQSVILNGGTSGKFENILEKPKYFLTFFSSKLNIFHGQILLLLFPKKIVRQRRFENFFGVIMHLLEKLVKNPNFYPECEQNLYMCMQIWTKVVPIFWQSLLDSSTFLSVLSCLREPTQGESPRPFTYLAELCSALLEFTFHDEEIRAELTRVVQLSE